MATINEPMCSCAKVQQRAQKQKQLQQAIAAGIESGDAGVLDMQAIKQKARTKAE